MNQQRQMRKYVESYHVDELPIDLEIKISDCDVIFHITFFNRTEKFIDIIFDNNQRQVEQSNIHIHDMSGERINFFNRNFVRTSGSFELQTIPPNGDWSYSLKGILSNNLLQFPGATYSLLVDETYSVQYRYPFDKTVNHDSNVVYWVFPKCSS